MSNKYATSQNWNFYVFDSVNEMEEWAGPAHRDGMQRFVDAYNLPFKYKDEFEKGLEQIQNLQKNIDLGGALDKARLKITDNPSGVFDFGLASLGLIRVVEFYSEGLAKDYPQAYIAQDLLPGVVPTELVDQNENGEYYTKYTDGSRKTSIYFCQKRQKGTTLLLQSNPGLGTVEVGGMTLPEGYKSKEILDQKALKFSSTFKRSYIEFDRKGGTVPYLDIVIPLQMLSGITGDPLKSLACQLPAIILSNFLNRAGVQTRIYAARLVMSGQLWEGLPTGRTFRRDYYADDGRSISFGDREIPAYCTAMPVPQRMVCLKLKDRKDTTVNIQDFGQFFSEAYSYFNSATWKVLTSRSNNFSSETVGTAGVTYKYATQCAWQGTYFERWLHWVAKERAFGTGYEENGFFMSPKLGANPAPFGRTLTTSIMQTYNFDLRQNLNDGELMSLTNPFGFHFYQLLDFAELGLGTDLNTVVNRIYKRWKENKFPDSEITKYVEFLARAVLFYRGTNPIEQYRLAFGKDPSNVPLQNIPVNPDQVKIFDKKNSELTRALVDLLNKLK